MGEIRLRLRESGSGRMGDLSGYNALPCNPGNAAPLH
jgi:hypothetical protein